MLSSSKVGLQLNPHNVGTLKMKQVNGIKPYHL